MTDDRFGDRVSVSDLSNESIQGDLPHPNDPWANASDVGAPFSAQPFAPKGQTQTTQHASPPREAPQPSTPPPVVQRPVPQVARISRKETATLKRFREVFGLSRISVQDAILERRDPQDYSKNIQMKFGLRGINHEDYQWVLGKLQELLQNPKLATFAWKISFVSMGVASIDGVPIWEVFGLVPTDPDHTKDPMYPHMGLRFQAAELFCEELRTSLFDTVESLYTEYENKVDSKYIAKERRADTEEEEEAGENQGPLPPSGSRS